MSFHHHNILAFASFGKFILTSNKGGSIQNNKNISTINCFSSYLSAAAFNQIVHPTLSHHLRLLSWTLLGKCLSYFIKFRCVTFIVEVAQSKVWGNIFLVIIIFNYVKKKAKRTREKKNQNLFFKIYSRNHFIQLLFMVDSSQTSSYKKNERNYHLLLSLFVSSFSSNNERESQRRQWKNKARLRWW